MKSEHQLNITSETQAVAQATSRPATALRRAGAPISQKPSRRRLPIGTIIVLAILTVVALAYVYPFYYLINTALKTTSGFLQDSIGLSHTVRLQNFVDAWRRGDFGTGFGNSLLYTLTASTISTLASLLFAFPVARAYVKGARAWNTMLVVALFLPGGLIATFILMLATGLYDTQYGFILQQAAGFGFEPLLVIGYLRSIPKELDEAAMIDGAGYFRILFSVIFPLVRPALVTVFLLHAIATWNDLISPTVFLADPTYFPLTLGLYNFSSQYGHEWTQLSAATLIIAFPLVLLFLFVQRYFIAGAINGAVKS